MEALGGVGEINAVAGVGGIDGVSVATRLGVAVKGGWVGLNAAISVKRAWTVWYAWVTLISVGSGASARGRLHPARVIKVPIESVSAIILSMG